MYIQLYIHVRVSSLFKLPEYIIRVPLRACNIPTSPIHPNHSYKDVASKGLTWLLHTPKIGPTRVYETRYQTTGMSTRTPVPTYAIHRCFGHLFLCTPRGNSLYLCMLKLVITSAWAM